MDYLSLSAHPHRLAIHSYEHHRPVLDEQPTYVPVYPIFILYRYQLGPAYWLPAAHVYQYQQLLPEYLHRLAVLAYPLHPL